MASFLRSMTNCVLFPAAIVSLSMLSGCDEGSRAGVTALKINGKTFYLEEAITPSVRLKGLGERTNIETSGGMLFVFPDKDVHVQGFIMRDCPIPIDIIYLDGSGRVLVWHEMLAESPRTPEEGTVADLTSNDRAAGDRRTAYDNRLKSYSSKYPAQFVIELKGGTIKSLDLKEGMQIKFDYAELKKRAS